MDKASTFQAELFDFKVVGSTKLDGSGNSLTKVPTSRIDIKLVDPDNRLTIEQIDTSQFLNEFDIRYGVGGAVSQINVQLQANNGNSSTGDMALPGISTDLVVTQTFSAGASLLADSAKPVVKLNNIGLSLGSTFAKIVQPIVDTVDDYIAPFKPSLLALDDEVPIISALRKRAGGDRLTWIEAIAEFDEDLRPVAEVMQKVIDIIKTLDQLSATAKSFINNNRIITFGDYIFNPEFDLRFEHSDGFDPNDPAVGEFVPNSAFATTSDGSVSPYVRGSDAAGAFLGDDLRDDGFRFPIFENPRNLFPLLFGRDISFVTGICRPLPPN